MANYDPKLTESMVAWLRKDHTDDESIRKGAEMLLKVNRNKGLYQRILRYPKGGLKKLEYELQKHVDIRLQGYSFDDIQNLDAEITPAVKVAVEEADRVEQLVKMDFEGTFVEVLAFPSGDDELVKAVTGKRPDHDSLPEEIQAIWQKNADRWKKIKETYNLLLTLDAPCDRFEHLKLLKDTWYKYRQDMCRYDDFKAGDTAPEEDKKRVLSESEKQSIDYAQSYISRYLPVLQELVAAAKEPDFADAEKLEDQRTKLQNRVNTLLQYGVVLSDQRKADLVNCDIAVELPQDDAQGKESE